MRVVHGHGRVAMAAVEHLQPDKLANVINAVASVGVRCDAERPARQDFAVAIILRLYAINELCQPVETALNLTVAILINEVMHHVGMVDLNPAIRLGTLPVPQEDGAD